MKRILALLLVLAWVAAAQPTPAWSTPSNAHRDSPGEWNSSGDDDEPYKSGHATSQLDVSGARSALDATRPAVRLDEPRRASAPSQPHLNRLEVFRSRIVPELLRLLIRP
jgi:hypothetical protein